MEKIYLIVQRHGMGHGVARYENVYFTDEDKAVDRVVELEPKNNLQFQSVGYVTFHSEYVVGGLHATIRKHEEEVVLWGKERLESIEKHNAVLKDYNDNLQVVSELLTETIKLKRLLRVMEGEKVGFKNSGE